MASSTGQDAALPRVIPERIREAREARGYTHETFGAALGVTRQTAAQYETGQISPSSDALVRIISLTRQPPAFFTQPRRWKAASACTPFWRSLKRMENADRARITRRLEWAADVVDYIESFISLPTVKVPDLQWDSTLGLDDDIEQMALRVRSEWSLGNGPIHDIVPLFEANGIILVRENVACEDMDAVSRWQTGRPYILYSAEVESMPRVNYNLAHELGHLILHSDLEVNSENLAKLERQANRFAGAFLLPGLTFSSEVLSTSLTYFQQLKRRWQVSIATMVYRSKDLGLLNDSQVRYLWRQMNALGIRKKEPLDDAFTLSKPSVLKASLEMLVKHRVQSKADIEQAINLHPEDIESLVGTEPNWLSSDKILPFSIRPAFRET
jgi:Zn-dependent peptidase ImmA (M78 family)/transcriptional regulator with XRE-family HTH domain